MAGKFKAKQAESCAICGIMYQLVDKTDLLRAATASDGDMVEYFVDEDDRVYLYYAGGSTAGVYGVELDPKDLRKFLDGIYVYSKE